MSFEPLGKTIKSLLSDHLHFTIPRFQRDFSWDSQNYKEFFWDMINQIEFDSFNKENPFKINDYFLGNMILLGSKTGDNVEVIDGQQRLTTITIFLAAIRDTLFSFSNNSKALAIANTIQSEYIIKERDGKQHRVLETKSSFPYFTNKIQDYTDINCWPTSEEEEDLKETFEQFLSLLSFDNLAPFFFEKFAFPITEDNFVDVLKAIRDQVLNCEVVSIYANDKTQANLIFENINSKGKPLSQVDLIKNYIFSQIPVSKGDVDILQDKWIEMKKKISKTSENYSISTSFDIFFMDYLKAKYPNFGFSGRNAYKKFKEEFSELDEIEHFIEEITSDIDIYIKIVDPKMGDYPRQEKKLIYLSLKAINEFKGKQVRIPLLTLFLKINKNPDLIKSSDLTNFVFFLANFHFSIFGIDIKFRANQLTGPFKKFSIDIDKAKDRNEVRKAIDVLRKKLLNLIPREEFIEKFSELSYEKAVARDSMKAYSTGYALKSIENYMCNFMPDHLDSTIEHILDEAESKNTNIGNLTLLENSINQEINYAKQRSGNHSINMDNKFRIYTNSHYSITQKLISDYSWETFGNEQVNIRARRLADYFYEDVLFNGILRKNNN